MNTVSTFNRLMISVIFLVISHSVLAADVGVSVSVGQPGFYGRIDIGDFPYPPPRLIYRSPIIVDRHFYEHDPVYLRVPPGHAKHWSRFCGRYDACGRPAYFVQDNWYHYEYLPVYRERHGNGRYERDDRHEGYGNREGGRGNHGRGRD